MTEQKRWNFIEPPPDFSPQIGVLVEMMAYTRMTTIHAVKDMTPAELDAIPEGFSNSVAMLLAHIAATDRMYQGPASRTATCSTLRSTRRTAGP